MEQIILSNQVRCLKCLDEPFSAHRHDYKTCKCGNVMVDGGMDYLRQGAIDFNKCEDMSIVIDELTFVTCCSAMEWARENNRNDLGVICAIFRALRDTGFLDKKTCKCDLVQ